MPNFLYTAVNQDAAIKKGCINVRHEKELNETLLSQKLFLVSYKIQKKIENKILSGLIERNKVTKIDIIQFCIHLEQLIKANVNIIDALDDIIEGTLNITFKNKIIDVKRNLAKGDSLSKALSAHPEIFTEEFRAIIKAGEESSNLSSSFEHLIRHYKSVEENTKKIKKALVYPLIVFFIMLGVFYFLMGFVVPQIMSMLSSFDIEMPFHTKALIKLSEVARDNRLIIILFPFILFFGVLIFRRNNKFKLSTDKLLLKLPIIGNVIRKIEIARFCHFFAVMFKSGVPILHSLKTAEDTVNNLFIKESLSRVRHNVKEGEKLSQALKNTGNFPPLVIRMFKIGEETGKLSDNINNVTAFYDDDIQNSIGILVTLIEPALILMTGIFMFWIVAAVFFPLYNWIQYIGLM